VGREPKQLFYSFTNFPNKNKNGDNEIQKKKKKRFTVTVQKHVSTSEETLLWKWRSK